MAVSSDGFLYSEAAELLHAKQVARVRELLEPYHKPLPVFELSPYGLALLASVSADLFAEDALRLLVVR